MMMGEENTNTYQQREEFCQYIRGLDPYDHPIVCHTFPGKYDAVYEPLLGFEHFEGPSLQTNDTHRQTLRWRKLSADAGRKWVVNLDEIGPAHTGVKPDKDDPQHNDVRKKHLWGNLMAGGGGVEWYFGYKFAHNDLNCEDWRSRQNIWDQTRHALDFFRRHLPFHEMTPADGLTESKSDFVFTKPGAVYAIYLPQGGTTRLRLPDAPYHVRWYDPRSGGDLQMGSTKQIRGPGDVDIGTPPRDVHEDWVALVTFAHLGEQKPPDVELPDDAFENAAVANSGEPPLADVSALRVSGFTIIDAETDKPLDGLSNIQGKAAVSLRNLSTEKIDVVANVQGGGAGCVRFSLNGEANYRIENVAPFALEGDTNGDFNGRILRPGNYKITATPYTQANARGGKGRGATLQLSVTK